MGIPKFAFVTVMMIVMISYSVSGQPAVSGPPGASGPPLSNNITMELNQKPGYSTFLNLLNQTGLAKEINHRKTITVLAVQDGDIGGLAGKPLDDIKNILSTHIILDYFDEAKLHTDVKNSIIVTNLYQTTGTADRRQGFLNISRLSKDEFTFASAVKDSPADVKYVDMVHTEKYNISVLHVSGVIYTPMMDGTAYIPPPAGAPKKSVAPAPKGPAPSPDDGDDEDDMSPEASPPAEAPVDAPVSSPPVSADAPAADDAADKNAPSPSKKSAATMRFSSSFFTGLVMVLVSSFAAL